VAVLLTGYATGQTNTTTTVGWYNGDRQQGIPGYANWYLSDSSCTRIYDDFVVPTGGWTVAGVFSNNSFYTAPPVTLASWEIRSGMEVNGSAGTLVASGLSAATVKNDAMTATTRLQVDGLQIPLEPGRYWLNVAPAGLGGSQSYLAATLGTNAVGNPPGNNGMAVTHSCQSNSFAPLTATGTSASTSDFSQGLYIVVAGAPAQSARVIEWKADIATLGAQLVTLHGRPLPGISEADFITKMLDLYNRAPALSDPQLRTGLLELVASIEDAHTDVTWPSPSPFQLLPLSLYWFDDGIYVIGAAAQYQNLVGGRVVSVGQTSIEDATRILTALVPHENDQWPKKRIPQFELVTADYLLGMGLIPSTDSANYLVQSASGDTVSADVQSFNSAQYPKVIPIATAATPLYRQHLDRNYWATIIDGGATVYFQYNSCFEDPKQSSADFFQELAGLINTAGVERLILDIRNNSGGDPDILAPWIDQIRAGRFNQSGRLYVIVGRATFSAAMEAANHLKDRTSATFVGEPTGAKPQFQIRVGDFGLPNFGIRVSYSDGIETANDPVPTMIPDIQTGLTFQNYLDGIDPALNAILAIPAPK
jgi:hypothetical protein